VCDPQPNSETPSRFAAICVSTFEKEKKKGGFEGLERREYSDEAKPMLFWLRNSM